MCEQLERCLLTRSGDGKSWRRVVIEKPFGHDLDSARELNDIVEGVFPRTRCSASTTTSARRRSRTSSLCASRTSCTSRSGTPTTSTTSRSRWPRTSASRGEAGYDGIGAARDVIQNHLLQLLALTAMEEPVSFDAEHLRAEKEKVLSAGAPHDLSKATARGQYAAGWQGGGRSSATSTRTASPAESTTETYAALKLEIDTRRWAGVPLPADRQAPREAGDGDRRRVQARSPPALRGHRDGGARPERHRHPGPARRGHHDAFRRQGPRGADGGARRVDGLRLRAAFTESSPEAYERLILDVLLGDPRSSPATRRWSCPGRSSTPSSSSGSATAGPSPTPPAGGVPPARTR